MSLAHHERRRAAKAELGRVSSDPPPHDRIEWQLIRLRRFVEYEAPPEIVLSEAGRLRGPAMARVMGHLGLGQRQLAVRALLVAVYRLASDGGGWSMKEG